MKKTTSKHLAKKLAQYGAMAAALGTVAETNGQVIYTDITDFNGDSTSTFDLDLNNDAVVDFTIFGSSIQILVDASSNEIAGAIPSYIYPFALNDGDNVDAAQSWNSGNGQILRYKSSAGADSCQFSSNWCGDTVDKYLGLRFNISGETHYGWVRLDVTGTNSMDNWTVKDFAYEATPDTAIEAGQTLSSNDLQMQQVGIFAKDKTISLENLPQQSSYHLYNLTGQAVLSGELSSNSATIEAADQASGFYILQLSNTNTNAVIRKKLIIN